jgi:hypothetical protein
MFLFFLFTGQCNTFYSYGNDDVALFKVFGRGKMLATILKDIPHFFFLSLVTVTLFYRSIESIISLARESTKLKLLVNEDFLFFSKYDIIHTYNLLNTKPESSDDEDESADDAAKTGCCQKNDKKKLSFKEKIVNKFEKYVYKWDSDFKFSSRVVSAHLVSVITLYYFFLEWIFDGIYHIKTLTGKTANLLDIVADLVLGMFVHFDTGISWGLLVIDDIQHHLIAGFVLAALAAYVICNIQCFLGLRSIKYDLMKFYRGDHGDILKLEKSSKIVKGDSHFTGFLVGFLINGFVVIFAFIFILIVIGFYLVEHTSFTLISAFLLKLMPVFTILVAKQVSDLITSNFFFLQNNGKYLALRNAKCYSLYVYATFFFDCFVGTIDAVVRLFIGLLGSVFFMPRIGYNFLGEDFKIFTKFRIKF